MSGKNTSNSGKQKKPAGSGRNVRKRRKSLLAVTAVVIAAILLVWTVAASLISVWASGGDTASDSSQDMKGVFVATNYCIDYPSAATASADSLKADADAILDNVVKMNMNTVILQVRPSADAFYKSDLFPWSRFLTGTEGLAPEDDFDPLEYWVEGAHERGLKLQAWINPYRITQKGEDEWNAIPETSAVKGEYADCVVKYTDGNYYLDPGNPDSSELIVKGALEIAENYDVDGISMDDYFYPGTDFPDGESWAAYGGGYSDIADWRRENVNDLMRQMYKALHKANPDIVFGISPFGIWANSSSMPNGSNTSGSQAYLTKYCDALTWISEGSVDYIAPQIYWEIGHQLADYETLARWWNDAVEGSDVDLYIAMAAYRTKGVTDTSKVWYGTDELLRQFKLNDTLDNVKGEIQYSYNSVTATPEMMNFFADYYSSQNGGSSVSTNDISIIVDGKNVEFTDVRPFIDENSRTLSPLRVVGDALGLQVDWDNDSRQAIFTGDGLEVVFNIDSEKYQVNGETLTMDTAAVIRDSRTYAPVRYLAEAAGYTVDWDNASRTVIITK